MVKIEPMEIPANKELKNLYFIKFLGIKERVSVCKILPFWYFIKKLIKKTEAFKFYMIRLIKKIGNINASSKRFW